MLGMTLGVEGRAEAPCLDLRALGPRTSPRARSEVPDREREDDADHEPDHG